jgi:hypothetical protein
MGANNNIYGATWINFQSACKRKGLVDDVLKKEFGRSISTAF